MFQTVNLKNDSDVVGDRKSFSTRQSQEFVVIQDTARDDQLAVLDNVQEQAHKYLPIQVLGPLRIDIAIENNPVTSV